MTSSTMTSWTRRPASRWPTAARLPSHVTSRPSTRMTAGSRRRVGRFLIPTLGCLLQRDVVIRGVRRMNEVNARRARLVLGWVTVSLATLRGRVTSRPSTRCSRRSRTGSGRARPPAAATRASRCCRRTATTCCPTRRRPNCSPPPTATTSLRRVTSQPAAAAAAPRRRRIAASSRCCRPPRRESRRRRRRRSTGAAAAPLPRTPPSVARASLSTDTCSPSMPFAADNPTWPPPPPETARELPLRTRLYYYYYHLTASFPGQPG